MASDGTGPDQLDAAVDAWGRGAVGRLAERAAEWALAQPAGA